MLNQAAGQVTIEFRVVLPDGGTRWVRLFAYTNAAGHTRLVLNTAIGVADASGKVIRRVDAIFDITDRKNDGTNLDACLAIAKTERMAASLVFKNWLIGQKLLEAIN